MAAIIDIKITGQKETSLALLRFIKDLSDYTEPLETSSDKYMNAISMNFRDNGQTFGELWPPLSPATIREKKKLYAKGQSRAITKPLVRTGALRAGFGYDIQKKRQSNIGNKMGYAAIHQQGGHTTFRGRRVKIPRRVLAEVDDKRIRMVRGVFEFWLNQKLRADKLS